jgi:hypothetical protein
MRPSTLFATLAVVSTLSLPSVRSAATPGPMFYAPGYIRGFCGGWRSGSVVGVPPAVGSGPTQVALAISRIAPNPSRGRFALTLESAAAGSARIMLHAATGRAVHTREAVSLQAGSNRIKLDAGTNLAPGVYWVHVQRDGATATRKVVLLP